jgi:hypothetical protein
MNEVADIVWFTIAEDAFRHYNNLKDKLDIVITFYPNQKAKRRSRMVFDKSLDRYVNVPESMSSTKLYEAFVEASKTGFITRTVNPKLDYEMFYLSTKGKEYFKSFLEVDFKNFFNL